jgi:two-component system sensor histidine kinase/response regulator
MSATQVLVVDDHQLYRETFCNLLLGCFPNLNIVAATDGSAALSLTHRISFALVVLDYQLPAINGGDVVRHLRMRAQKLGTAMPPIVLMSSQPDVVHFARMLRVDAFLPKPTTAEDVMAAVGPIISRPRHEASAPGPVLWRIRPHSA